ncbi:MAG: hypothetical protein NVV59_10465 [Chitinophagaceae bacterium]|nr:hypothetical protein [Chitinophagaceae bacterium]
MIKIPRKADDSKYTAEEAASFSLEDVKKMIEIEVPGAFSKEKARTKKAATKKAAPKKAAKKAAPKKSSAKEEKVKHTNLQHGKKLLGKNSARI